MALTIRISFVSRKFGIICSQFQILFNAAISVERKAIIALTASIFLMSGMAGVIVSDFRSGGNDPAVQSFD
jgi:hypothetical protein